ncbi:hypothetical protein ACQ86N_40390 [Puia sp. P3]|uniref:hypothetical protein n=1 Tax=Puia sp. P3 TaxID=3423952 RepID=UPI003D66634F
MKAGMDEKYASYPENMVTGPAITLNVQQVLEDETIQDLTAFCSFQTIRVPVGDQ